MPQGESKYDKKGRLRADGFKLAIVPDEARVIQRSFCDVIDCKAITKIAKALNDESVPTKVRLKGGSNCQQSRATSMTECTSVAS